MSWPERRVRSGRGDLALAVGVLVALFAAMMPLLHVVDAGWWVLGAVAVSAAVLGAGVVARRRRMPAIAVTLIEAVVWVLFLTAVFGAGTAFVWVIPSPGTFEMAPLLVGAAVEEVRLGSAPLSAGMPLSFLIVGVMGLLAIVLDHVVLTARLPLLAAVGLVAVSLVPSIAVPGEIDLVAFALLAASILFLLRVETRSRQRRPAPAGVDAADNRSAIAGASATALGIGAIAVVVALVASPLLPTPLARAGYGGPGGGGTSIDPSLELGDDLRQPREMEVLQVRSTATSAPYLRAVTLSQFDGSVWEPDAGRSFPLAAERDDFEPVEVDSQIAVSEYRTTVQIIDLNTPWLPVAFPAIDVDGLEGAWSGLPYNRTVVSRTGSSTDQAYEVTTAVPRPTLEQIRDRYAGGDVRDETLELPDDLPPVIAQTAREVTASAQSDYDALLALQSWFRGPDFRYSLEAPVADGFDGTGAEAVADFLEVREGYCVHFASAFALMARTLDMPTRIVVGYLPGTSTGSSTDGQTVYSVTSGQLHAWPEVHFDGIGWIGFEPTNSLGVPTSFVSGTASSPGTPADRDQPSAGPSSAPSPTATAGGPLADEPDAGGGGSSSASSINPWPALGIATLALLLLAAPGLVRELRRRRALRLSARGDAAAAWLAVQELAIDLGVAVPGSESPRAFGVRLTGGSGAPPAAMELLVAEIERASYAEDGSVGPSLADAVDSVRAGMLASVPVWRRALAVVVPRSLLVRPGSAYADAKARVRAA